MAALIATHLSPIEPELAWLVMAKSRHQVPGQINRVQFNMRNRMEQRYFVGERPGMTSARHFTGQHQLRLFRPRRAVRRGLRPTKFLHLVDDQAARLD